MLHSQMYWLIWSSRVYVKGKTQALKGINLTFVKSLYVPPRCSMEGCYKCSGRSGMMPLLSMSCAFCLRRVKVRFIVEAARGMLLVFITNRLGGVPSLALPLLPLPMLLLLKGRLEANGPHTDMV